MSSGECLSTARHDGFKEIISGAIYQGVLWQTGEVNQERFLSAAFNPPSGLSTVTLFFPCVDIRD